MSVRGRRSIIIGIVGCLALGVLVVATRGHAAPPSPAALYSYPPNARLLIAAGLTGRPVGQNLSGPVTIDLLLIDGVQTTVLFHVAGGVAAMRYLTLSDDHGRLYQWRSTSMSGSGFAMLPRPIGWRGALWDLLRLVPFLGAGQPARGYAIFASLPPTAHTATVRSVSAGSAQALRIPLHLAALRTLTRTVVFRRRISRPGIVVTLQRVSRGPGSAALVYTLDAPALASGTPDGVLPRGLYTDRNVTTSNTSRATPAWSNGDGLLSSSTSSRAAGGTAATTEPNSSMNISKPTLPRTLIKSFARIQ